MSERMIFGPNQDYTWIDVQKDDQAMIAQLMREHKLTEELLSYALDENENAHVEYDDDADVFLLVFNVIKKYSDNYETAPVAFIATKNYIYSFTTAHTSYINEFIKGLIKRKPQVTRPSLIFKTLYFIVDAFFPVIKDVDKRRTALTETLKTKTTNRNLLALSDLGMGLVYLVNATQQNSLLLSQLKKLSLYHSLNDDEQEQLEDVEIEADQLVAMANLSEQILEQISSTYNNLLNNNLNDTMRLLTIWSLLLTVPTIVTGFFGMNVLLPLKDSQFSWLIIIFISVLLSIGLLVTISRKIK